MQTPQQNIQSEIIPEVAIKGETSMTTASIDRDEDDEQDSFYYIQVRDSGYAWIILAAMFVSNVFTVGYIKGFGLIYNSISDNYPSASGTMSGVMMGLLSGCRSLFSPLTGSMANKMGIRKAMCLGASIYCISLLASYYCTTTIQLSITLGAFVGLSHCIIDSCQVIVMPQYFESKLSFANGIRVAGNPFGGILYPVMLTSLFYFYDLRSFFIMISALTSHLYVCAFLMRPISVHIKIKILDKVNNILAKGSHHDENNLLIIKDGIGNKNYESYNQSQVLSNSINLQGNSMHEYSDIQYIQKRNIYNKIMKENKELNSQAQKKSQLNYKFLKNPHYICFLLLGTGIPMGLPLVLYYMTLYAKTSIGLSPYEITILLSVQAVFDFFLRIFIGWLNNKNLYKKSHGFIFCLWCSALASALVPHGKSLIHLILIALAYSLGPASFHCFTTVLLCEQFGKENIASTWGFVRMTQGIFSFVHPILIGYALDLTGSYTVPFLIMGLGLFVCGVSMGLESLLGRNLN